MGVGTYDTPEYVGLLRLDLRVGELRRNPGDTTALDDVVMHAPGAAGAALVSRAALR
jgi:hypothetical protein